MNSNLPSLSNSIQKSYSKQKLSQSSLKNITYTMADSSKTDQKSLRNSTYVQDLRESQRRSTYQDISYIRPKQKSEMNLSLIVNDPKEYELLNKKQQKSNLYTTMYKLSFRNNFRRQTSPGKTQLSETKPLFQVEKNARFHKYLQQIIQQNSQKIVKSSTPPNRQQALDLAEWLSMMIQEIKLDSKLITQETAQKLQLIYSQCMSELIRQISIECKERGAILQEVWDNYVKLIENVVQSLEQNQHNTDHYKRILEEKLKLEQEIHQLKQNMEYEQKIQIELNDTIIEQKDQISEFKKNAQKLNSECRTKDIEMQKLKDAYKRIQNELNNLKAQNELEAQQKQIQNQVREGKSIVSHILEQQNKEFRPSFKRQSSMLKLAEIEQILKSSEKGQHREESNQSNNELTPIRQSRQMKSNVYHPEIIVDDMQTQTDPFEYSSVPIINEFIKQLIANGEAIAESSIDDRYEASIRKLSSMHSMSEDDKTSMVEAFQMAQVQLHMVKSLKQEQELIRKESLQQKLTIQEEKANTKYLDAVLKEATQQFLSLLKDKNKQIKQLEKSKTKLLTKLNSLSSVDKSRQNSPAKKTPIFPNSFNFRQEDIKIVINANYNEDNDLEDIEKSKSEAQEIMEEEEESESSQDDEEEEDEDDLAQLLDDPLLNSKKNSEDITQKESNDASPKPTIKSIINKYGITRQGSKRFTRASNIRLSFLNVKKEKKVKRVFSQNQEAATSLLKEIMQKKSNKMKDAIIPTATITKLFNTIIAEAQKNPEGYKIPMYVGIYDFFLKKYGFKNVVEKKIKQLLQYIYHKKSQYPKMQLFAKLCNMDGQVDETAYKLVVESQKYFIQKEIQFNKLEIPISIDELNEYCQNFLNNFLGQVYTQFILNEIKQSRNQIQFEQIMIKLIDLYFQRKSIMESNLKLIFQAADLDGNKLIEFTEFKTLYKAIHPKIYSKQKALEQFLEFADYIEENTKDKMITLSKFAETAIELNLFQQESINQYSVGSEQLVEVWEKEKIGIKFRYLRAEKFQKVKYIYNLLTEQIELLTKSQQINYELETLWISYKLLYERSLRVILNQEVKEIFFELLPLETILIQQTYLKIEDINNI